MAVVENLSNNLYKLFLRIVKYLPYLIAILDMVNTFLSLYDIDLVILTYISGIGLLPILFILVTSITFKYCSYHRIPIYYILINNMVSIYDYYYTIPCNLSLLFAIYLIIALLAIIVFTILYIKERKNE